MAEVVAKVTADAEMSGDVMTTTAQQTISYASPVVANCPLCDLRPVWKKKIYEHPVCKKCFYKFANRRQLGYLLDSALYIAPSMMMNSLVLPYLGRGRGIISEMTVLAIPSFIFGCIFCLRDSVGGVSPGKWLTNLQVLSDINREPIGPGQSFKRNAILLVSHVPILGSIVGFFLLVRMSIQVGGGYRMGDRFAQTRVIWKKFAYLPMFGGDENVCRGCGYSLEANVSGVCPECGRSVERVIEGGSIGTGDPLVEG